MNISDWADLVLAHFGTEEDDSETDDSQSEEGEVDTPRSPVQVVLQTHDLHRLLQPENKVKL